MCAVPVGCGVRAWGPDGLGTGAQGRGREGAEGVDVDYARGQEASCRDTIRELTGVRAGNGPAPARPDGPVVDTAADLLREYARAPQAAFSEALSA